MRADLFSIGFFRVRVRLECSTSALQQQQAAAAAAFALLANDRSLLCARTQFAADADADAVFARTQHTHSTHSAHKSPLFRRLIDIFVCASVRICLCLCAHEIELNYLRAQYFEASTHTQRALLEKEAPKASETVRWLKPDRESERAKQVFTASTHKHRVK